MSGQFYIMNVNRMMNPSANEVKPVPKEKVMSYEEKSVGSTPFFKCEACPYMAMAEDDIKFHLFTVHPDLAKSNGLADNIQIPCPGCTSIFDAEETLRTHLRNHHKMGIKDVKKMIKSLVQIALKNAKLRKDTKSEPPPVTPKRQDIPDMKMPQVIEIVPDAVNANGDLPKGVAFISVDELHKMSTPNFEKVDPKDIIQEASINIVYTNDISTQYVCSVSEANAAKSPHNVIQVSNVPPDLISSIQPRISSLEPKISQSQVRDKDPSHMPYICKPEQLNDDIEIKRPIEKKRGAKCLVDNCRIIIREDKNMAYHRKCHQNGKLTCPECSAVYPTVESLHMHLWKLHMVDIELPTCDICGFKTYNSSKLRNNHMRCHRKTKPFICPICSKAFKTTNQLSKHKQIHKTGPSPVQCSTCLQEFRNEQRLKQHVAEVHEKLRKFKCSTCEYTTTRREQLKIHMRSHTGDKPHACNVCDYRSADHNALRRHKKQHSKENSYKCKYCPYTAIQSTVFASHMISKHPNVNTDIHKCPYCPFKSVNKEKYVLHLTTHTDKDGIQHLIEMTKNKSNKPCWTIPSETDKNNDSNSVNNEQNNETAPKTVNEIPIEVYDCDSLSESGMPQSYSKEYCATSNNDTPQTEFNNLVMVTDLSKDDNNSDCLISESSNDTLMDRHQYQPQHPLLPYDTNQSTLHEFLHTPSSMGQSLLQNNNVNSLTPNHCSIPSSISNNIMNNFPIRLPSVPQVSLRNNITLKPVDKISLGPKVTGPIIKPTQILPVPSLSNSPVNISAEPEGVPRKKPKISVKSNLILKGPDQVNMFHSQQKMAFRRLENNERFGLGNPVTFNNLITTQFMQMQPEPSLSESPNNILPYPQEPMLPDTATTPVDSEMNESPQIFSFNQQMNVNSLTMLPPPQKITSTDPSYIKLEATIKQNTQSPSLERMCNANLLNNPAINREYKASPPLEDIHKNMNEIKNEVKSDQFYNLPMNNAAASQPILDQYLMDNLIGEKYSGLMDLSGVVLQEISEQQNDVIEIDDNSDDNKLLPRLDMFFPLESLYPMHNDFHFLENEIQPNNIGSESEVVNRMVDMPMISQKEVMEPSSESSGNDLPICIQGLMDPVMNTAARPTTNKINVKNIELMKN